MPCVAAGGKARRARFFYFSVEEPEKKQATMINDSLHGLPFLGVRIFDTSIGPIIISLVGNKIVFKGAGNLDLPKVE